MQFSLRTFGQLVLLDGEGQDVAFPEKALLILAYLLATGSQYSSRATIARFLWGDDDVANSLTNLRKLISRIKSRQANLGVEFLGFDDTDIHLITRSLATDIASISAATTRPLLENLAILAQNIRSKFLAKANCQSRIFVDWRESERKRYLVLLKEMLDEATHLPAATRDVALVKEAALVLFEADPRNEDIHPVLLRAFEAEGGLEQLKYLFEQRKTRMPGRATPAPASPYRVTPVAANSPPNDAAAEYASPTHSILRIPRIALLPPGNDSINAAAAMVASSLIEDITLGFCTLHSLRVIAPYSAMHMSRQSENRHALLQCYDIDYVLDTRLSGSGNDLSLFAQLINLPESEVVWANHFTFGNLDLARNKRDISRHIVLKVAGHVEHHELARAYFGKNPAAYHQYLVGQQYLHRLTVPNMHRARAQMNTALRESSDFAPALSSVARTYSKEWLLTARGDAELLKSARAYATQAIALRSDLADGYRELGVAKLFQGSIEESIEALELAETLSPHHADLIADHADTLVHSSQPVLALQKIQQAMELNPINPDSYIWIAAGAHYALGQFQTSLDCINQMVDPSLADRLSAANLAMLGHADEARATVRRIHETNPGFDIDRWLSVIPFKEQWHKDLYREGLKKAGF
ncbi:hypothetical protein [Rhizobium sp. BR 314]|uniref:hypothetical protein n=1 Tax=Rhizobium sp. BR 314 TaxID=3040013 RepID=UPI0039BFEB34